MSSRGVYWNDGRQRIRWTTNTTFENYIEYEYIGSMTRAEFDLLLEILVEFFGDDKITMEQFVFVFDDLRNFCDKIKGLMEE
tara:strand:+ start:744 stop:989 length:246 start_codon:yes stop_codon:yes gene_type:complete